MSLTGKGSKETHNKLTYELDWDFIEDLARRMGDNKGKYEPYNWKQPMDVEELKQAAFRHMIDIMRGRYADDGHLYGHVLALACNAMFIYHQLRNECHDPIFEPNRFSFKLYGNDPKTGKGVYDYVTATNKGEAMKVIMNRFPQYEWSYADEV